LFFSPIFSDVIAIFQKDFACVDFIEQKEIMKAKGGTTLNWEDTRNMKYTWWVIQETLRLQPTVGGAFRVTLKDFEYKGFTIPKGWKVKSLHLRNESIYIHLL
jgi:hypothetical protein